MKSRFLSLAPNGARKTQSDHPKVPLLPDELAQCAKAGLDNGVAMLHLHVRDDAHRHSLDVGRYRLATEAVRKAVGQELVIQITTEAVGVYTPAQQMATVRELRPEAASVGIRELLSDPALTAEAEQFFTWMHAEGIAAQYILYDAADVRAYLALRERGSIPDGRHWVLFVLGRYTAGQTSQPSDLLPFLEAFNAESYCGRRPEWSVCAFGRQEADCALSAMLLGGHARIGFENNLLLPDGQTAADNNALLQAVSDPAGRLSYRLASAHEMRERIHSA
jgi:uncharacterized protein (DUF849 family)